MFIISVVLSTTAVMILFANSFLRLFVARSVRGSHRKYVLTTTLLLCLGIESLAWAIVAVVDLHLERYFSASISIILSVWALWIMRSMITGSTTRASDSRSTCEVLYHSESVCHVWRSIRLRSNSAPLITSGAFHIQIS